LTSLSYSKKVKHLSGVGGARHSLQSLGNVQVLFQHIPFFSFFWEVKKSPKSPLKRREENEKKKKFKTAAGESRNQ